MIFIIGTCSDLYYSEESKMESIKTKNEQLVAELDQFCEYLVYNNKPEGELIHPVNNICEGEECNELSAKLRKKCYDSYEEYGDTSTYTMVCI